jgi:cell division protein FtsN
MDEPRSLSDVERWRDRIEVRLDNRQVFFLFFGSALMACLLFVLGVIVGKRLESRGQVTAPKVEDPLALLDKMAFAPRYASASGSFSQAPAATAEVPLTDRQTDKVAPAVEVQGVAATPDPKPAAPAAPPVKPEPPAAVGQPEGEKREVKYALQIGSFPDRPEAEAFALRYDAQDPYVIQSEIPGKGLWYRVRMGGYQTQKEALVAKMAFENKHHVIAFVVPGEGSPGRKP